MLLLAQGESADNSNNRVKDLEEKLKSKIEECDQQKSDYEDLLVLLEDQDEKIKKFKVRKLRAFIYVVSILFELSFSWRREEGRVVG